jgi:uncharacterized protein YbjT (DUF2867 family)
MTQTKFLITGATGDTGGHTVRQHRGSCAPQDVSVSAYMTRFLDRAVAAEHTLERTAE